jgi:hypothetical protein
VNLKKNVLPEDPLGALCALLLLHGCSLNMTLDEVYLFLLGCNYISSALILCLSFHGILYAGGHQHNKTSKGLLAVGPDMAKVLVVAALHNATPSSVYLDGNMVKALQLEFLFRFYVSC